MKVYLCEKPSQGKAFANALGVKSTKKGYIEGNGVIVTWAIGHLVTTYEPKDYDEKYKKWDLKDLPIIPENWKTKTVARTKDQFNVIKGILNKLTANDEIYISTDADREGELIGVELIEYLKCPAKRMRIWNKSLDEISLKENLSNPLPGAETHSLYLEALARQRADWLTGMNLTIAITNVNRGMVDGVFSIGRVQTPTLNLVVERDLLIENFKPKPYYELMADFAGGGSTFKAKWKPEKNALEEGKYFTDKDAITDVKKKIENKSGKISKFTKELKKSGAPVGFSLSTLLKVASSKYGYTSQQVLDIMQSLYETHKLTSYPRSDCQYLPMAQFVQVPDVLKAIINTDSSNQNLKDIIGKTNAKKKSKIWNDKEVSAHHAIIPTRTPGNISALSKVELNMYNIVRNRYIAQFLPEYEYYASKIEVTIEDETFEVSGNVPHKMGWKEIEGGANEDKEELPQMTDGETVDCKQSKVESKKTKPPSRYTDSLLIEDMKNIGKFIKDPKMKKIIKESQGIGTEATRSNIMETLVARNFIKRDKKHIISTDKGRALISISPKLLKDPETSAYWEQELNKIGRNEQTYEKFINQQATVLKRILNDVNNGDCTLKNSVGFDYNCDDCKSGLRRIKAKTGKFYWVHAGQTECKSFYPDNRGKPGEKFESNEVDQGDTEHKCTACQTVLIKRKGGDSFYWACPNYKKCGSKTLPDDNGKPGVKKERVIQTSDHKCPECDPGYLIERQSNRNGKKSVFWGCSNFPKCKYSAFDDNGKPQVKK
jgi:DNA topoisomerase-3